MLLLRMFCGSTEVTVWQSLWNEGFFPHALLIYTTYFWLPEEIVPGADWTMSTSLLVTVFCRLVVLSLIQVAFPCDNTAVSCSGLSIGIIIRGLDE